MINSYVLIPNSNLRIIINGNDQHLINKVKITILF